MGRPHGGVYVGGDGEKQVAAQQQDQAPQESGGCGTSWSHPRPPRGSSEHHSMRTPGAQGLSHRPRKASPSSLPGSLDSERREEVLGLTSGCGGSSPQGRGAASFTQGQTFQHSPRGGAPPEAGRARQGLHPAPHNASQRHLIADQEDLRREPRGLAPTHPRLLCWQDHSPAGAEGPATPCARPEPNRNHL